VLDITLNEDGLFVFSAEQNNKTNSSLNQLTHRRLVESVTFLPGFGDVTSWLPGEVNNQNVFTLYQSNSQDNAKMTCSIDKATLTTTACTYLDEQGRVNQMMTFEAYKEVNNIAWPMRVSGKGDNGNFDIHFSRVAINEELSQRAFVPSRRAKKQP